MILDAAEPLLLEHGRSTSTRQIAEAAGIAEGTIFRVFDSKDAVINNVVMRTFSAEPATDQLARIDRSLPLEPRLVEVARVLKHRITTCIALLHALGPPQGASAEDRSTFLHRVIEEDRPVLRFVIELIEPDEARLALTPTQTAQLLITMINSASHPMMRLGIPSHLSGEPEAIVDLVLHGCLAASTRTEPGFDHRAVGPDPDADPFCPSSPKGR